MPFADDHDQLQWVEFQPAEELSLLTGDLCSFFGGCEQCPGLTTVGVVRPGSPENPNAPVFCLHWCHRVPHEA